MARTRVWCGATVAAAVLSIAASARGEPDIAVLNAAGEVAARAEAADRVAELRAHLVGAGVARELPPALRPVLEAGARGPSRPEPHAASVESARRAYASFAYGEAQELLEAEVQSVLARGDSADLAPALAQLCFWRGKVAVAQADRNASARWFGCVLNLDPTWAPDPATEPPQVQRVFARAKRQQKRRRPGTLRVAVRPAGAQVTVDRVSAGEAPTEVAALAPGLHLVVATHPGHERRAELVEVRSRGAASLDIHLAELPAEVRAARALETAVAEPSTADQRAQALSEIAALAGAGRLLVIEAGEGGALQARLVDVGTGSASEPAALGHEGISPALAALVGAEPTPVPAPATESPVTAPVEPALDLTEPPPTRRKRKPWYRSPYLWVGVVAAAAAGGTFWVLGQRTPHFSCCTPPEP